MAEKKENPDNEKNQTTAILALIEDLGKFTSEDGTAYAEFSKDGHLEVWPIRSDRTIQTIQNRFYQQYKKIPNRRSLDTSLDHLEFQANASPKQKVYYRTARIGDTIYIDLGSANYELVEIDANGWRVVSSSPAKFVRSPGTLPLPIPMPGGEIHSLRSSLNTANESDFLLTLAYIVGTTYPSSEYPLLILQGPQGSTKSTMSSVLKRIIDPTKPILRSLPRNEQDLFIAAKNAHLITFDNLSGISNVSSDTICKLATGCGISTRKLYTNHEEVFIELARPIIINGIDDLASRGDLADRALVLHLPKVPESKRLANSVFWERFESQLPGILGCIYSSISHGLKRRGEIHLDSLPRMADFALTACACLEYFGYSHDSTLQTLLANRTEIAVDAVESNSVGRAVRHLALARLTWVGTSTDLFLELSNVVGEDERRGVPWPRSPQGLSRELFRMAPSLKLEGIEVQFQRTGKRREIKIARIASQASQIPVQNTMDFTKGDAMTEVTLQNGKLELQ